MVQRWWSTMLMGTGTRFPGPAGDLGLGTSGAQCCGLLGSEFGVLVH